MNFMSVNPASGQEIARYEAMQVKELYQVLERSHHAFLSWREESVGSRARYLKNVGDVLLTNKKIYARLMTDEMGKPISEAMAEIEKCAWACKYYSENGADFLKQEIVHTQASKSYVCFEGLGMILAIMPWNFPFWQVFRFAAPALLAGNVALLKHAPNVMGCAKAIESIFLQAGFPEGVFANLPIEVCLVEDLIADPRVAAVTLTGSTRAGSAVASIAGRELKKCVLELGGSDPFIVLSDADIDQALDAAVKSRFSNAGQSCIAAKRLIVVSSCQEEFEKKLASLISAIKMGDPIDPSVQLGPMARLDLRDNLHRQVSVSVAQGAKLILGGQIPEGPGYYYPPTLLTNVRRGMSVYQEEVFGPVAVVIPAANDEQAIEFANDTAYGLGATVFTKDVRRGEEIAARHLQAGACFVNKVVASDPRLPFGGIKKSGFGRELSHFGMKEFVNIKTVSIA